MKGLRKNTQIDHLMQSIFNLPGKKILTLIDANARISTFDISEEGVIGYHKSHKRLFYARLRRAINTHGGLVIRQFLPIKVERISPSGKKIWIPIKNVYGVYLGEGSWAPLSAAEIREVSCTDAKTGKPLPPEQDVRYRAFPVTNRKMNA